MTLGPLHRIQPSEVNDDNMLLSARHPTEIRHKVACDTYRTIVSVSFRPFPHQMMILPCPIAAIDVPLILPIRRVGIACSSEKSDLSGEQ